ncbi:transcription initiation factor TFIID subunit 4-like isoform X3 [Anopheles stephensi]|uniref:transcription initiation factor TFIID subunit 4-like isoform X3 n=1 Tax=Anopheles stephensi TaxID=30069 RepID=UPI00165883E4|nr:transcription initiation factor TFIID subunit 4-like isoform X3 [Anopheles stephensi]
MASANFLEEALKSDVDESAVNAIVGTLENQLDANTAQVQQVDGVAGPLTVVGGRVVKNQSSGSGGGARIEAGVVSNGGTGSSSASPQAVPSTLLAQQQQQQQQQKKHGSGGLITNGEIVSNSSANHGGAIINNNTITTNNNNLAGSNKTFVVNAAVNSSITTVIGGKAAAATVGASAIVSGSGGGGGGTLSNSGQHHQQQRNTIPATVVATGSTPGGGGGTVNIISQQIVVPARGGGTVGQHPPPPFNVPPQHSYTAASSSGNIVLSNNHLVTSSNMPKNEPVKLVYPAAGGTTQTAVLNMNNNRVTLTPSSLPNGTLTMSQQPQLIQTNVVATGGGTKTIGGTTIHQQQQGAGQPGQQQSGGTPQTIIIKNSAGGGTVVNTGTPGIMTVSKPINNQATPNIVGLPGVQIVNVRPGAQQPTQAQQKTVAAVSPRVVIGSQPIVSTRPPNASAITLSALQGQQGSTLLLKNEQGQFQLLRIGPAPAGAQITPASLTGSSANSTIRLQTVPATHSSGGSGAIIVSSQSITTTPTSYISTQPTPVASVAPVPALAAQQNITITHSPAQVGGQPTVLAAQHQQQHQQQQTTTVVATPHSVGQQQQQQSQQQQTVVVTTTPGTTPAQQRNSLDNTKEKCSKFLTNLIELSKREPAKVEQNVRTLIQELVDANVDPAEFCERLERLLNASPQPCLIGFLKKSLPLLRQSLVTKEITIEGINPPSTAVAFGTTALSQIPAQIRPVQPTIVSQSSMVGQTQIRMLTSQSGVTTVPRIGQTTIRPAAPVRIQTPLQQHQTGSTTIVGPARSLAAQQIRPNATTIGHTTIVQTAGGQPLPQTISTTPPALLPVSGSATTSYISSAQQNLTSGASKKKASSAAAASGADADSSAASKRAGASAQSQFYHHHASMYGDDDINDVAAMGGVNLAEETQRILGSTEFVGTQIRSCKDEVFLHMPALQSRIRNIIVRHGLEEPNNEVAVLISHACQERLKNIVEKLAIIAEHRIDIIKVDPRYEITKDVRGQIKFLEELDKAEQKRHEEQEREMLMRAAKSRSKTEDPEQAKLKAKAKEMQRAEMEELRQRDANLTALQAIGPRKKPKLEEGVTASTTPGVSGIGTLSGKTPTPLRPRIKRVNLRDMLFYLEQERDTGKSQMLYKAYLK